MSFRDRVDREFERRRKELLDEIARDGAALASDLGTLGRICARDHPIAWIGGALAAGASLTATKWAPRALGSLLKLARRALPAALPLQGILTSARGRAIRSSGRASPGSRA